MSTTDRVIFAVVLLIIVGTASHMLFPTYPTCGGNVGSVMEQYQTGQRAAAPETKTAHEPAPIMAEWPEGCDNFREQADAAEERLMRLTPAERERDTITQSDWQVINHFVSYCHPNPEARTRVSYGFYTRILGLKTIR